MKKTPDLSIVIPFYNEEKNIQLVLSAYEKIYSKQKVLFELLCVNNGSTDNSDKVFTKVLSHKKYSFVRLVKIQKNIGYGNGIIKGVRKADGNIIAWTHADMQTDAKDVVRAYTEYKKTDNPNNVIKGTRIQRSLSSFLFSFGMAVIASGYLKKWFYEINAQPKLFHRSFVPFLKNAPKDFSLDLYFLYQCKRYGFSICTIPVYFRQRIHGQSKWAFSFSSRVKTIKRTISYIRELSHILK